MKANCVAEPERDWNSAEITILEEEEIICHRCTEPIVGEAVIEYNGAVEFHYHTGCY